MAVDSAIALGDVMHWANAAPADAAKITAEIPNVLLRMAASKKHDSLTF
jgi:hypothetical protein